MNAKLLVVLVVLLVILFVVGAGLGARSGSQPQALPAALTGLQATLLGSQPRLHTQDIDLALPAACADQFARAQVRLAVGQSCIFFVGRAQAQVRRVAIELAPGQQGAVRFDPADADRFTVDLRLDADRRTATVDLFQAGGELRLDCLLAGGVGDICLFKLE
jgi:hypothetical protein